MKSKTISTDSDTSHRGCGLTRRSFLLSSAAASLVAASSSAQASPAVGLQGRSAAGKGFPKGFLWGAATAGHQVEGNNINSDIWALEHVKPTIFAEPSGDACDHYHRYADDIKLLASLSFNTYRFSIEWSRIEPEQGAFSRAELEHYRRMLAACRENNITPMVSFNHFSVPRWFAALGGGRPRDAAADGEAERAVFGRDRPEKRPQVKSWLSCEDAVYNHGEGVCA